MRPCCLLLGDDNTSEEVEAEVTASDYSPGFFIETTIDDTNADALITPGAGALAPKDFAAGNDPLWAAFRENIGNNELFVETNGPLAATAAPLVTPDADATNTSESGFEAANTISQILDPAKYPTLVAGAKKLADLPKAYEETSKYLGFGKLWEAINLPTGQHGISPVPAQPIKGGRPKHFAEVPVSSTKERYAINAQSTNWVEVLLEASAGKDLTNDDAAACMITYLMKHHPNALPDMFNAAMDARHRMRLKTTQKSSFTLRVPLGVTLAITLAITGEVLLRELRRRTHRAFATKRN